MPPEQGVWLHDEEGLLPGPNQPGQQDQEDVISPGDRRPFHLSLEDEELLPQQGVFCHQFSFISRQIGEGAHHQGGGARFHPMTKAIIDPAKAPSESLPERVEDWEHNVLLYIQEGINVDHRCRRTHSTCATSLLQTAWDQRIALKVFLERMYQVASTGIAQNSSLTFSEE